MRKATLAAVLFILASQALASGDLADRTLTEVDRKRLADFDVVRTEAIAAARGGDAAEVKKLDKVLAGEPQTILGVDIRGDYRCRVAKLGGSSPPLVVYDWFRCRIGEDDLGYRLDKLTGSQRVSGHFIDEAEKSLIFYGADHYSDEEPKAYNDDPERNTVGRLFKVGEGRYRLELPRPFLESDFDILELEKTRS